MKSFSEFNEPKYAFYHLSKSDKEAEELAQNFLAEDKKSYDAGQGRMVYFHKAHVPNTQDHLHFEIRGKKLYALNQSGSAHDRSHGKQMANWALDALSNWPNFKKPKDGFIESVLKNPTATQLIEGYDNSTQLVTRAEMFLAELHSKNLIE